MSATLRKLLLPVLCISATISTIGVEANTDGVLKTFLNATDVVCPHASCDGFCSKTRDVHDACFCDDICEMYGDCCYDYWSVCKNETLVLGENRWIRGKFTCRSIAGVRCEVAMKMVIECPDNYGDRETAIKCKDVSLPYRFPVFGKRGYVYGNKYCAACHGEHFEDLLPFQVSLQCPDESAIMAGFENLREDDDRRWLDIEFHCLHNVKLPPELDRDRVRFCNTNLYVDNECKFHEELHSKIEFETIFEACHSYQGIVATKYNTNHHEFGAHETLHKNSHCALCDGIYPIEHNVTCPEILSRRKRQQCFIGPPDISGLSFTVLLDLGRDFGIHIPEVVVNSCPDNQTYVEETKSCELIACPDGYEFHHDACRLSPTYVGEGNDLTFDIEFYCPSGLVEETKKYLEGELEKMNLTGTSSHGIRSMVSKEVNVTEFHYTCFVPNSIQQLAVVMLKIISTFSNISHVSNITFHGNISSVADFAECQESQSGQYSFHSDSSNMTNIAFETLSPHAASIEIQIEVSNDDVELQGDLTANWTARVCANRKSDCPYVLVSESRVTERDQSKVVLEGGKIFDASDFFTSGNKTFVCTEYKKNYSDPDDIFTILPAIDVVHYYMTVVGLSTSIAGLMLTLLVYSLLEPLRTVPGKILMNLILSLLLAQFFFLFGSDKKQWPTFCIVSAALEHYLWLVSFVWMNVISLDLAKTFMRPSVISKEDRGRSLLFAYAVCSWGLPLLHVGACLGLDLLDVVPDNQMKYASKVACFLSGYRGMLYAFVLPLTVIMAINVVCFIGVVVILSKASSLEKKIQKNRIKRNQMFLVAKLLPITGLTWIFGVVATLGKIPILWNPFIVLNSLQGLLVFIAFVFNGRVMGLLRAKLLKRSSNNYNDGTATITTKY